MTNCTRTPKADASRHKAMNYGYIVRAECEFKAQIAAAFVRAKSATKPNAMIRSLIFRQRSRPARILWIVESHGILTLD